ncbi:MAG: repressor LexA [Chloroflexi bacterium]|nr:repressor LexA [Chloroflexota bacterium]
MTEPSPRRQKILRFIREFAGQNGYSPTLQEIMQGCGINSMASVQHHLGVLEEQGEIRRNPRISRSIQLVESDATDETIPEDFIDVFLLGAIAAGEPIPVPDSGSWETISDEVIRLPTALLHGKQNVFALNVKGTSMIDDGICDGDIIVMEPAQTVNDGESVAVWLKEEQEVTLKRLYRDHNSGMIRLQPRNEEMSPIFTSPDNVEVQGKPLLLVRDLRS